jgi:excisionase family DNA binding protein
LVARFTAEFAKMTTDVDFPARLEAPAVADPIAVKPKTACRMLDVGLTRLYELLGERELESYTDGRSRKITTASIHDYVARRLAAAKGAG